MQISGEAVVALMHIAGFPSSTWQTGAAIAYAESSWNTTVVSPTDDLGLWQINRKAHADKLANKNWKDPIDNTVLARQISNGGKDWSPWVAYTSGSYKKHLGKAKTALQRHQFAHNANPNPNDLAVDAAILTSAGVDGSGSGGSVGGSGSDAIDRLVAAVETLQKPEVWIRIGMFLAGGMLIMGGVYYLILSSKAAKAVVGTVVDFIPGGKIASVAKKAGVKSTKLSRTVKKVAENAKSSNAGNGEQTS